MGSRRLPARQLTPRQTPVYTQIEQPDISNSNAAIERPARPVYGGLEDVVCGRGGTLLALLAAL